MDTYLKVSSFCSGIGSFEVAMKNLAILHEIVLAAEIDKYARETYSANHEYETMYHDMTKEDYVGEHWYSDINISGLPCQSFSLEGKRLGELDPRGLLFFDFYRYVKNQHPKYFIIENVKGLLSDNDGNTFQNWINLLGQSVNGDQFMFPHEDSLMYNLHWSVLNTKDYGLPQNRERVFLVGIRNDLPNTFVFPKGVPLKLRLKDVLEDNVDEKYYLSDKMLSMLDKHSERHTQKGTGFSVEYKNEDDIANCLRANAALCPTDNILKIPSATKSGYETAEEGNSVNLEHPNSETRRGRVGKQVAQTLTTSCNQGVVEMDYKIGAFRGRNPENPNDRTAGANLQQTLEINENGTSNYLTSVQKDNVVVEQIIQLNNPKHSNDRIYSDEGLSPTLNTMQGGNRQPFIHNDYRIRKLTPKECFRLQGFPDEFHDKAVDAGVSNSQLYKQAGNSISVPVIQAILKNLLK